MLNLKRYVHAAFLGLAVVFGGVADAARTIVPAEFQNQGVATIAALKALPVSGLTDGQVVQVACYYTCTTPDGGGGPFKWDSSSSASDNGGTIIAPDAGGTGRWRRIYSGALNVKWFGAKGDGSTNDATAVAAAVTVLMGTTGSIGAGGELYFPPGDYRLTTDPFGILPHDNASVPTQASLRLYGAGAGSQATSTITNIAASKIDFRYTTANNAKIDTRGRGRLEIDHLTLMDTSGNAEPFIHTTNTAIYIHDNEFMGSKSGALADQDAIILGGTDSSTGGIDGTADAPFQGYGSQIHDNHFQKIRRVVYLRAFANGVPIHHNTVWNTCGSNLAEGAAFEYDGDPLAAADFIAGTPLHHNLIESVAYKYGVKMRLVVGSTVGPNDFYDETAPFTAQYRLVDSNYNQIIGGFHSDSFTFVSESGTAVGTNSWTSSHQSREQVHAVPVRFKNNVQFDDVALGTAGTAVIGILAAKANLDFTALAANTCEELDITVTGARPGNTVALGITDALARDGGVASRTAFTAWVRANDTVRVRRCNITGTATADPASAEVTVTVIKMNV